MTYYSLFDTCKNSIALGFTIWKNKRSAGFDIQFLYWNYSFEIVFVDIYSEGSRL